MDEPALPPQPVPHHSEAFNQVYNLVVETIDGDVTPEDVAMLVAVTMRAAEDFHGKSGPEKKKLVLDVVQKVVEDLEIRDATREQLRLAVHLLAPGLVDTLISAAKGQFGLTHEEIRRGCNRLFRCCARE